MCLQCESSSSCFQPGDGPSRGLLRENEPSDGPSFQALVPALSVSVCHERYSVTSPATTSSSYHNNYLHKLFILQMDIGLDRYNQQSPRYGGHSIHNTRYYCIQTEVCCMSPIFSPLGARLWCAGLRWAGTGFVSPLTQPRRVEGGGAGRGGGGESSKVSGYYLA